jgi:hypothetical protein
MELDHIFFPREYQLAHKISMIWAETKTKTEIEKELYQLLILLPLKELKEINKTLTDENPI